MATIIQTACLPRPWQTGGFLLGSWRFVLEGLGVRIFEPCLGIAALLNTATNRHPPGEKNWPHLWRWMRIAVAGYSFTASALQLAPILSVKPVDKFLNAFL
ncbi:MAG: hypothetical protein MI747_18825 [Desulfobacterales bacterium]|nr:hypothetical protein [Desulfobacterales bacterium]